MNRWDWYQGTCFTGPDEVLAVLERGHELSSVEHCSPIYGYARGAAVVRGDRQLARCYWGGSGPDCHVVSTSEAAVRTAEILRFSIPHSVTRVDACQDFESDDSWDRIEQLWKSTADRFDVKLSHIGDFHRAQDGRTLMLGAPSSVVRARCYEKGKELGIDRPITRAEVQCRPKGHARDKVAKMEPSEVWGLSSWSRSLGELLTSTTIKRVQAGTLWKQTAREKAFGSCMRQYGPTLRFFADELGSWDAVLLKIRSHLDALAKQSPP